MKGFLKYLMAFIILSNSVYSQTRVIKPAKKSYPKSTNLAISGSVTRSVLYLSRNVKEDNDALGYSFSLIYDGAKLFRMSFEYTRYNTINIEPTWYDIHASTAEVNGQIIARFRNNKAYFYPLFGVSYNIFSGYFTGRNDFLGVGEKYKSNTIVSTNWFGVNIGTGYEYRFKAVSLFMDYKMRVGKADRKQLNIMDVCYSFGLRYNLRVPSIYKIFSGTKSRYLLDTEKAEK